MEAQQAGMILNLSPYVIFFRLHVRRHDCGGVFVVGRERALLVQLLVALVGTYR